MSEVHSAPPSYTAPVMSTATPAETLKGPKVTVIGLRGIPDISGGIETHCEYLYPKIADMHADDDYVVIGRRPSMGADTCALRANLSVVPLAAHSSRYLETLSNTFVGVLWSKFKTHTEIIHLHAVGPGLMAPLGRFLGMKVILTHHGDDYKRDKWNWLARSVLKAGERVGVAASHRVIAVSPSLAARLKSEYPKKADAIHYIPNGADHILDEVKAAKHDNQEWLHDFGLEDTPFIVSVGRLVPEKGFADLINAYAIARPAAKLVIVGGKSGSSHDEELVELIAEKGLQDHVILTGAIPREGVAALLTHCKLFVLASHHEGLPIAALEAAAIGAPILVSDIQPNIDLGLDPSHYFPVRAPLALAEALNKPWENLRQTDVLERFNWGSVAAQTNRIYDTINSAP